MPGQVLGQRAGYDEVPVKVCAALAGRSAAAVKNSPSHSSSSVAIEESAVSMEIIRAQCGG